MAARRCRGLRVAGAVGMPEAERIQHHGDGLQLEEASQSSTTLPAWPARIASKPCWNSV